MRFLMLNWRDPRNPMAGGAERVSEGYLRALASRGHEISWFANRFPGAASEENLGPIQVVRGGGKGSSVWAAYRWYQTQAPFDLVIDQHHGIPWYAPWWSRTRTLAYIHEVLGPIWNVFYPWPWNFIGRWQERLTHWAYRNVEFWVPSESTRQRLLATGVRKVTAIPNGIDTRPLPTLPEKPLNWPLQLVVVSRLSPNKRIDHAVRAVHQLRQSGMDVRLAIVGTGEVEESLRRLVADLNLTLAVRFTGKLSEAQKNDELAGAHLLLHTSVREGWGLNVLEANAMGTPALVYPVDGLVDSTLHRQTGLITEEETPESLVRAVRELLSQPGQYGAMREKAWRRAKDFQWEVILPQACDWLESKAKGLS